MKIGLLFAGQGAQYTGMGKSLYASSEGAKKIMDSAGEQIKEWCFDGTKEMLRQTQITQPCIYTVSMAAYQAFREEISKRGEAFEEAFEITGVAGFSLGEYSALAAAGVIETVEKGLEIVKKRGELMLNAGTDEMGNQKGGMIAAFGKRQDILDCVEVAREDGILEGVNFNSSVQTVVAGDNGALERFKEVSVKHKMKIIPLSVSTAFHSPMMEAAVSPLKTLLLQSNLRPPGLKIYCNVTGDDMFKGREAKEEAAEVVAGMMAQQAKSPVYWQETIENMARDGIETLIEIGPGKTLSGLVKKIAPQIQSLNIEDKESLEIAINTLAERVFAKGENVNA